MFFPEMSAYKIHSYKTKCRYFMMKDEKYFDKYMTIWRKVSNIIIIKKLIMNLYMIKII